MQLVTETDLRAVLQLPNRPYSDPFIYEGSSTPYYDLSRREATSLLSVSGTVSSTPHMFVNNTDFSLHDGVIDWTLPGIKPDLGTVFTIEYTYSRLASGGVSTSVFLASNIVTAELGPSYPWGQVGTTSVDNGFNYNDLARMMQIFVAAREACYTLAAAEIDLAAKYRRGSVLVDDTKKTDDWRAAANEWNAKYEKYLNLVRPKGQLHHFSFTSRDALQMVFADWGALQSASSALREELVDAYLTGDNLL